MAFCGRCGHPAEGAFCARCGAPTPGPQAAHQGVAAATAPPPERANWAPITLLVCSVILIIGVVGFLLWPKLAGREQTDTAPQPVSGTTSTSEHPTGTQPPASPTSSPSTSTTTTTDSAVSPTHTDSRRQAQIGLEDLYETDNTAFSADGQWIAQLSSKCDGIKDPHATTHDGSHTFGEKDILAETTHLHSAYGTDVRLVKSTDFGTQMSPPCHGDDTTLWTTIYDPGTFASRSDAQAWCNSHFSDRHPLADFCLPRQATAPHE